ncbi:MAG: hypothetical protein ACP5GE_06415 [Thermoplasmata archaeon]|nr:hypothetical protein [Thermoplasmatales archaeon]PMP75556.1 MAG: hypothetical protein C0180_01040 [Aciduliprofundum sp.]
MNIIMEGQAKIKVVTFWKDFCPYCKGGELCKFHRILEENGVDPSKPSFINVRRMGKKYSIRIFYQGRGNGGIEISLSIPNQQLTVIGGAGSNRKSLLTLIFTENIFHEIFLISGNEEIKKLKAINFDKLQKIYKNSIGD